MLKVTNRLYELRKQHGLKQELLALQLGITRKTVSNIENNKAPMSKKILEKVCIYFNIEPKDVLNLNTELKEALKLEDLEPVMLDIVLELQFLKSSLETGTEAIMTILNEQKELLKEIKKKNSEIDARLKRRKKTINKKNID